MLPGGTWMNQHGLPFTRVVAKELESLEIVWAKKWPTRVNLVVVFPSSTARTPDTVDWTWSYRGGS